MGVGCWVLSSEFWVLTADGHMVASYVGLWEIGELARRAEESVLRLASCELCARRCGADRLHGRQGKCRTGRAAGVSSYGAHFGEEAPLVGSRGSGTIFFACCNLACIYCQNHEISHLGEGMPANREALARTMVALQSRGCHNVNLVSPTHVVPQILEALVVAAGMGLRIPLVYNTGGYDTVETLRLLEGVVDIYMPDMKYSDDGVGLVLSGVAGYAEANRAAVKEMQRQVGDLVLDERGLAMRGLLVRHLVLPEGLAGTEGVAAFLAREVSRDCYVNVMDQYRPAFRAWDHPALSRRISRAEYRCAVDAARATGLTRLDQRCS